MQAIAKRKSRLLVHTLATLGVVSAAVIVAACSQESSSSTDEQGIGLSHIDPVANAPEASMPMDAVPSPDGKQIYFIAFSTVADEDGIGTLRLPAIFKAAPGAAPQKLFEGSPLGAPFGITISDDGQTLFIADSGADTSEDRSDGKVFSMSVAGGTPTPLAGTDGLAPGGIEAQGDSLYVTGRQNGQPGVFKMGLGGGNVTALATGGPFVDPSGVAVAKDGTVYVVDSGSPMGAQSFASVVKVAAGKTEVLVDGLSVGHPAGIALVKDETAVLVSALDPATSTDRVYRVELASRQKRELSSTIGDFSESAGLHRARQADVFAWADTHANGSGTVYVLTK